MPLSDSTVVASSACGVDLFEHIRYLMFTAIPAMVMALVVFFVAGITVAIVLHELPVSTDITAHTAHAVTKKNVGLRILSP